MAKMWPNEIPRYIIKDSRRSAEVKVFKALQVQLSDEWEVYYSRPWWGLNPTGGEADGEADFVVVHPDRGVLFIEVKGGAITYEPEKDQWFSKDRLGIRYKIKDPVMQALTCKHQFLKLFKQEKDWPKGFIRMRHGVLLTDSISSDLGDKRTLGKYPLEIFGFQPNLQSGLGEWVKRRVSSNAEIHESEIGPGFAGAQVIRDMISGPVNLRESLATVFEGENQESDILLTGTQLAHLRQIEKLPRSLIEGPAGTGKTLLALLWLKYRRKQGEKVFYSTKSKTLLSKVENLSEGLGIEFLPYAELSKFLPGFAGPFSLVIDETQDLDHHELDALAKLTDRSNVSLMTLMDSNQAIYNDPAQVSERLNAEKFLLDINLRNTEKIATLGKELYSGPLPLVAGPEGTEIIAIETPDSQALETIYEQIDKLKSLGVQPQDIAVLTFEPETALKVTQSLALMNVPSKSPNDIGNAVIICAAGDFKGLESQVVLLLASKELSQSRELSYVAVTRARNLLIIVGKFSKSVLGAAITNSSKG